MAEFIVHGVATFNALMSFIILAFLSLGVIVEWRAKRGVTYLTLILMGWMLAFNATVAAFFLVEPGNPYETPARVAVGASRSIIIILIIAHIMLRWRERHR